MRNSKLSIADINAVIIAFLSGQSKVSIARDFGVHVDTITRALKTPRSEATLKLFKIKDGVAQLAWPGTILQVRDDFIVKSFEVTGNPLDGVIVCEDVYITDETEDNVDPKEGFGDWFFNEHDMGVLRKFRIGKIVVRTQEYEGETPVVYDPSNKFENNGQDTTWIRDHITLHKYFSKKQIEKAQLEARPDFSAAIIEGTNQAIAKAQKEEHKAEPVWSASNKFISITEGRKTINADSSHPNFKQAIEALVAKEFDKAIQLLNIEHAVSKYVKNNVTITNGQLFYQGVEIKSGLTRRIIEAMNKGEDFEFFLPFLENLMLNPSDVAIERLFDFLQANDIEITADGHFIAWKKVRSDFLDIYTGTMDNSPGKTLKMVRGLVNSDDNQTCSAGLHVCAKSYLNHYGTTPGNKVVRVKVHPKDVVSIPVDYASAKMRTCEYTVLDEVKEW